VTPAKNEWQIEHIKPNSLAGTNSEENGQVLCRRCNRRKSNNNDIKRKIVKKDHLDIINKDRRSKYKRIHFPLVRDEDGYPPFSVESLWGIETVSGTYRIDNLPFYVYEISLGDEVSAYMKEKELIFNCLLKKSSNSTIRIFSKNENLLIELKNKLENLGCTWEFSNTKSLSSINIPNTVEIKAVENIIKEFSNVDDTLDYETSCVRQ
jgi:hypothetical protein